MLDVIHCVVVDVTIQRLISARAVNLLQVTFDVADLLQDDGAQSSHVLVLSSLVLHHREDTDSNELHKNTENSLV